MLIKLDLNMNDAEALLRHCAEFQPASGDCREDSRLADALDALGFEIKASMRAERSTVEPMEAFDPRVLEATVRLFQDDALAINWLVKPMRALGGKRPIDADVDDTLTLISRLEHGIVS